MANEFLNDIERKERDLDIEFDGVVTSLTFLLTSYQNQVIREGITDSIVIRQNVERIIEESGYADFIQKLLSEDYQDMMNEAFNVYNERLNKELNISEDIMNQLVNRQESESNVYEALAGSLTAKVTDTLLSAGFQDINGQLASEDMINSLNTFSNQNKTEITNTLFTVFTLASVGIAIEAGLKKLLYVGPLDEKTRPFCERHTGEVKTLDEWNSLDNGQRNPVGVYRGGYKCRHSLIGVS